MEETAVKINKSLFGGYNKKSTDVCIQEFQTLIARLQGELGTANEANAKYAEKLAEAEAYYKALWEKSKEQKVLLERQKGDLKTNENIIKVQKETIRSRGDVARKQEGLIREKDETIRQQAREILVQRKEAEDAQAKIRELEEKLSQKEQTISEQGELIAKLENKIEKQEWLYEEFFQNRGKVPVSKLERFIQDSVRRRTRPR